MDHRDSIMHHEAPKWHARYTSMCCWFWQFTICFANIALQKIYLSPTSVIFHQTFVTTSPSKASVILKMTASSYFSRHLNHYVAKNKLHTINTSKITNDTPKTDILYSDDYVWIESVNVFAKIKLACQNEGILFDLSRQELYQKLESEKLLITKDNRRSYEYRKGQFRQSVICLPRNNLNRHLAYDKEDIKL